MGKLYYVLLDLKEVVIYACFNVTIYIEFRSLTINLCILSTRCF
jgi:hypothetical protein